MTQAGDSNVLQQGLVDQMKQRGCITTATVEEAFRAIPRHLFLPEIAVEEAYRDQAITTKEIEGQFVSSSSQPTMMAIMLEQLELRPGQRVLEIGAGTGFNAALMAHLVGETGQVVTIDIDEDIVEAARAHLATAGFGRVQVVCADGIEGYEEGGPYDRIILTVGASDIAPAWLAQLKPEGRLLLPLSLRGPQVSATFVWEGDHLMSDSLRYCGFISLRGELAEQGGMVWLGEEEGQVLLRLGEQQEVDAERVYHWLLGERQVSATAVQVMGYEMPYGLSLWLALHTASYCILQVPGAAEAQQLVPYLFEMPGRRRMRTTFGLLSEQGLGVLMREAAAPRQDEFDVQPFYLSICTFGSDIQLAERLKQLISAWDGAGHPNERRLAIRAYPQTIEYEPTANECVVARRWMRFVCNWKI